MKYLPILLLFFYSIAAQAQPATVSLAGIGDIKVGMKQSELEKLIGQPVKLVKLLKKENWERDTINFIHKDVPYQVVLDKDYINDPSQGFIVYEVKSNGPALKTKSGIAIGDDKLKIVSTYGDYTIQIMPEYENDYTVKSKTKSTLWLFGDDGKVIIFYLTNNKVTGFTVMYNEGC